MAKYTRDDWKPGQKVWFQSSSRYQQSEERVVKSVGRTWVTIDRWCKSKFTIETGVPDVARRCTSWNGFTFLIEGLAQEAEGEARNN